MRESISSALAVENASICALRAVISLSFSVAADLRDVISSALVLDEASS